MYYKERVKTNGFWQYQSVPFGDWYPFTEGMLNRKIQRLTEELKRLKDD